MDIIVDFIESSLDKGRHSGIYRSGYRDDINLLPGRALGETGKEKDG